MVGEELGGDYEEVVSWMGAAPEVPDKRRITYKQCKEVAISRHDPCGIWKDSYQVFEDES